jgi:uncharacterized membrane protein
MKTLLRILRGPDGHPLHPPFTDATIGAYTVATILAVLGAIGVSESAAAKGWWLALVAGLALTVPTAVTGLADWLQITRGTPLWRTATSHMVANVCAAGIFLGAAIAGHAGYVAGDVAPAGLALTIAGFAVLMLGGWLGGTIVFVHGMRVLNLADMPASDAVKPDVEKPRAA